MCPAICPAGLAAAGLAPAGLAPADKRAATLAVTATATGTRTDRATACKLHPAITDPP